MDYFIGDLHFGHAKLLQLERHQFKTIEEHDQYVIDTINQTVKITDTLYILGDVGTPEKLRYLNGKKILILGNHDKRSLKEYEGFAAEVHRHPFYYSGRILLSHEPHPVEDHVINVHGHLHGAIVDLENYINTSANDIDYKPITINDIQKLFNSLPKAKTKFLEEWYAGLYKFKGNKEGVITYPNGRIKLGKTIDFREKEYQINIKDNGYYG